MPYEYSESIRRTIRNTVRRSIRISFREADDLSCSVDVLLTIGTPDALTTADGSAVRILNMVCFSGCIGMGSASQPAQRL